MTTYNSELKKIVSRLKEIVEEQGDVLDSIEDVDSKRYERLEEDLDQIDEAVTSLEMITEG